MKTKTGNKIRTLEQKISSFLPSYCPGESFAVRAFELWREPEGWSMNDSWKLASGCNRERLLEIARGRWEVFKANYASRARVCDIEDTGYVDGLIDLEVDCLPFLGIETTVEAYFDRFTVEMPFEAVGDCSHQGDCQPEVRDWLPRLDLSNVKPDDLRAELAEYGAWEEDELQEHQTNLERIIWIAAGNIREEMRTENQ